tara:strand:+ start:1657 stop:1908 length:252 start_codon:yes stop_codon:yes gene_type:complete
MKNNLNIKIYGTDWCSDCTRAKSFLDKYQVEYNWFNIELDKELQDYVREMNNGKQIVPTIIFNDGTVLVEPTNAELAEKLGIN